MKESKHIVQKLFVEVNTSELKSANLIKDNINLFLKTEILPEIEKLFLKYDNPELISRIQNMDIQFSTSSWNNKAGIKKSILNHFEQQIEHELKNALANQVTQTATFEKAGNITGLTEGENNEEIFLFFLENGYLPWYGDENQIAEFEKNILKKEGPPDNSFIQKLSGVLHREEESVKRLVNQFSAKLVVFFLIHLNPRLKDSEALILSILKKNHRLFKHEWLKILLKVSVHQKSEIIVPAVIKWFTFLKKPASPITEKEKQDISDVFKLFLAAVPENILVDKNFQGILNQSLEVVSTDKKVTHIHKKIEKEIEKEKLSESFFDTDKDEVAVQNAGLIILHPFLKAFFNDLKITNSKGKIKSGKRDLAVQLMHFLATGEEMFFESNLVFEKFLCGFPLKMSVKKDSLLTPELKKETSVLLESVIWLWPELKNTSPDGLRQMFLIREGKLTQKDNHFKVIVERKAQDILLEKLAWNISILKLPWIDRLVYADW